MRNWNGARGLLFVLVAHAAAQQPEAGVWFLSPSPTGASADTRFEIETRPTGEVILWAPFGKTPVSWGPIALRQDGSVEFHSAGNPPLTCTLSRADERNYEGACGVPGGTQQRATLSRNGPPNGLELPISDLDFRILAKARQILSGPSVWNRHDQRYCDANPEQKSWSLFCALYQASFDVAGVYVHLRPALEEVRAVVGEVNSGKSFQHQLMDYNNLDSTTYADIKSIFDRAEKRLRTRKACSESHASDWQVDGRRGASTPEGSTTPQGRDAGFWGEGLRFTIQRKTYLLVESLGPMASQRRVPDGWLAASAQVERRTWKHDGLEGVDLKGRLPNGNHWRYLCLCGESWRYYDVPVEAEAFFDHVIDGAYSLDGHR